MNKMKGVPPVVENQYNDDSNPLVLPEKPKRPLSAYNIFFQEERVNILKATPTRNEGKPRRSHGKIGFADLARAIAAKWKSISPAEKKKFEDRARDDKSRYVREMDEWKERQREVESLLSIHQQKIRQQQFFVQNQPVSVTPDKTSFASPAGPCFQQESLTGLLRQGLSHSRNEQRRLDTAVPCLQLPDEADFGFFSQDDFEDDPFPDSFVKPTSSLLSPHRRDDMTHPVALPISMDGIRELLATWDQDSINFFIETFRR